MVAPLKVGVAGLGNVGAAVVRLIRDPNSPLAARCGRAVDVAAVCARDK
ncbi:MAG: homoserine dehydrogenase, partial [Pseudorhodoplanes sp.]